jgi:hypothetical protein
MTRNRHSNRMKPNGPPTRGGGDCAVRTVGIHRQGPNGQIETMMIDRARDLQRTGLFVCGFRPSLVIAETV